MQALGLQEGESLVRIARQAIEAKLGLADFKLEKPFPDSFKRKSGAFITLNTHPQGHLRGCIGFSEPKLPLLDAVVNAALAAAFKDPRFEPVKADEMNDLVVELTVLSPPELIETVEPQELVKAVEPGKHGLMVEYITGRTGLLLPQVAVEHGWGPEEFLAQTCVKAGLPADTWKHPDCKVYRFSGQIFVESEPGGPVIQKQMA